MYGPFENTYNTTFVAYVTRLNSDGTLDTTFNNINGINSPDTNDVYNLAILPNGNIFVVGLIFSNSSNTSNGMVMLNSSGSVIPTFNTGYGLDDSGDTIGLQSDGKIIIGGYF